MLRQLEIDLAVYSLDTVKKAAYRLSNQFSIDIQLLGQKARCELSFPPTSDEPQIERGITEFKKELLDQDLRQTIARETEGVRNIILAHAFSRTDLIENEPV